MTTTHDLARLRGELDRIDDDLLDLVERRLALCSAIGEAKRGESADLKLRPARERAVVARLRSRAGRASPEAISHIWRELMAHSLQSQARTRFLLWTDRDPERLLRLVRERFGSAAPVEWAASAEEALRQSRGEEVVAILPCGDQAAPPEGLVAFETLRDEDGGAIAWAIGRVAVEEAEEEARGAWSPSSWRRRPAMQMPAYPDAAALETAERALRRAPSLVGVEETEALKRALVEVAEGRALLLQGGDCAETFREFSEEKVRSTADLLLAMGRTIRRGTGGPVVHVARMAGQFAKPRSTLTEIVGTTELPAYRGDAVNGAERDAAARNADPGRMLRGHRQAAETLRLLGRLQGRPPLFVSHEALLLHYEEALTRFDPASGRWWAGSGDMLWIGDRTRGLGGAHVEFARGLANPIGLKCGPGMTPDELLRLIDVVDPEAEAGRLTLIARLGREAVGDRLPRLMRAVAAAGRRPVWVVDPMHGNTRTVAGFKTRLLADILAETRSFIEIAASEGVVAGGVHLELTGTAVTECLGGGVGERDLGLRYLTACDPRLNPEQAREVAALVADTMAAGARGAEAA